MRLGIDLGGTKTEILALGPQGVALWRKRIATPRDYGGTVAAIAALVEETEDRIGVRGSLGLAIPGCETAAGVIKNANSVWLNGRPLRNDLERALARPVRLANDANCFALSEASDGAAALARMVFGVIAGTGLGGGVVVDGKVLGGAHGVAGEWGHIPLPAMTDEERADSRSCYCGKQDCLETWCGGPFVEREFARLTGRAVPLEEIAVSDGDEERALIARLVDRLARGLAVVVNILDPDVIVLGGGLSNIARLYDELPPLVERYGFTLGAPPRIVKNKHGIPAACAARHGYGRKMLSDWPAFCRDCLSDARGGEACAVCGSTRIVAHPELDRLSIAHMDCDAFYAAIEKRDDPSLNDKPLIVGGEVRGVVSTACYIARKFGVRSAMPMFQAKKLCPQAVVLKPRHAHYSQVARQIRAMMEELTPLVEPLSLDEAYLDLGGTERIHHRTPARTMAALAARIEREVGITVSVGLSGNKFLAKLASELDKPRGFAVIGMAEAKGFLRDKPVGMMRGAGKVTVARLARDGITTIGQLQDAEPRDLANRYGATGLWLSRMANAQDSRPVDPEGEMKTISSETTFDRDLSQLSDLEAILWRQAERVSARAKKQELAGRTIVLKLKTADFRLRTRSASLDAPTQLADRIFRTAQAALKRETDGTRFRLLGVGISNLTPAIEADPQSLVDVAGEKRAAAERAMDRIRAKFGGDAVGTGRGFRRN